MENYNNKLYFLHRVSSLVSRKPVLIHYTPLLSSPSISPAAAHGRIPQNPTLPPAAQPPAESLPVVVSDKPCRRVKRRYPPVVLAGLVTPPPPPPLPKDEPPLPKDEPPQPQQQRPPKKVVFKKWQHPAAPFFYEQPSLVPSFVNSPTLVHSSFTVVFRSHSSVSHLQFYCTVSSLEDHRSPVQHYRPFRAEIGQFCTNFSALIQNSNH
ncbi:hypothetical protein JHK87_050440 [Glycine soja]|nr:hypothetical protein JHK87_050440 [Glycine soja]